MRMEDRDYLAYFLGFMCAISGDKIKKDWLEKGEKIFEELKD